MSELPRLVEGVPPGNVAEINSLFDHLGAILTTARDVYDHAGWIGVPGGYRSVPHGDIRDLGRAIDALDLYRRAL